MNTLKRPETAEDKCQRLFKLTFKQYFHWCMDDGLKLMEMHTQLDVSRTNFRRLMKKYNLFIREPASEPMFSELKKFRAEEINYENVLYRKWGSIISF